MKNITYHTKEILNEYNNSQLSRVDGPPPALGALAKNI